ncbi:hypothetical protein BPAE_0031g00780 [Botrytis paeoniae]|uniref:Uncharacterized protein n=1 Tax=Botrytis paeoniae TaxID=278948 RepID=A0A4Z1G2H5_9HELO|nr:hypothetical protein BPAE_0031g00780 [Botrytis paeoniae]
MSFEMTKEDRTFKLTSLIGPGIMKLLTYVAIQGLISILHCSSLLVYKIKPSVGSFAKGLPPPAREKTAIPPYLLVT